MGIDRATITALFAPAAIAVIVSVGYFMLTQNWTSLASPVAGMVAVAGGILGAVTGALLGQRKQAMPGATEE